MQTSSSRIWTWISEDDNVIGGRILHLTTASTELRFYALHWRVFYKVKSVEYTAVANV